MEESFSNVLPKKNKKILSLIGKDLHISISYFCTFILLNYNNSFAHNNYILLGNILRENRSRIHKKENAFPSILVDIFEIFLKHRVSGIPGNLLKSNTIWERFFVKFYEFFFYFYSIHHNCCCYGYYTLYLF